MGKKIGKMIATVLVAALVFLEAPTTAVVAAEETTAQTWVSLGNGYHSLQGTDIKVQIANDMIRITGTGEIPDFDYWKLYERPWHGSTCKYVMIDDTITSIGKYAFYKMQNIKYIFLDTKTFIEDETVFEGIAYMPIFRITGNATTTKMIGSIAYTSLDSIQAFAQTNTMGAAYILDSKKSATSFQTSVNPSICNVYYATDKDAPWNDINNHGNGNVATSILKLSDVNPDYSLKVSAQRRYPGMACYEAYAAFIGEYNFATTYSIVVEKNQKTLTQTDKELQYVLTIPEEYRQSGREFRLLAIGSGIVYTYDDLDANNATITFATDKPSTAYALVYR